MTKEFYIYPVILGQALELWIVVKREALLKKYRPILNVLKFEDRKIFFRPFIAKSLIEQASKFTLSALKTKGIGVTNLATFKKDIKKTKKRVKK